MTTTPILFRPSNGSEGHGFESQWCELCKAEKAYRDSGGEQDGCPILIKVYALQIDDPGYPKEWRRDGPSGPRCTAFVAADDERQPLDPSAVVRPLL